MGDSSNQSIWTGTNHFGNDTNDTNDTNEARSEAVDRLIELHQDEFDLLFDACQIAEELKHRPVPVEPPTYRISGHATTTSTSGWGTWTTTVTPGSFKHAWTSTNTHAKAKSQPKPRPQPLNAIQKIVARFRR